MGRSIAATTFILPALLIAACGSPGSSDSQTQTDSDTSSSDSPDTDGSGDTDSSDGSETDGSETETDTDGDPNACWTDLAVGELETFYAGFTTGSEGLAFGADGQLYVTTNDAGDGTIWRLDPDAEASEFAKVPYALGLAPLTDGGFIVASIGENNAADGAVYRVDAQGNASELATGIDSPNFVAIAPDGAALISDDFDTRVFRVTPDGQLSVIIEAIESPNGLAYSPDGAFFYAASTFTPLGQLTRYEVGADGLPIEASAVEILQLGQASTPDGIAVDVDGRVYVAANLPGQIWRVDGSLGELQAGELVAEDLPSPASLAFGQGPDFDPCSVYVSSLFGNRITRVHVGVPGALAASRSPGDSTR